jgi:hypothetical protein
MYYNLYTVYDSVAEECAPPFIAKTDGLAQRLFVNGFRQANRPDIKIEEHSLYRIGSFDNETMKLVPLEQSIKISVTALLDVEG